MKFTREQVIEMAKSAAQEHGHTIKATDEIVETLMSFASLAADRALEAAENRCTRLAVKFHQIEATYAAGQKRAALECGDAIRAMKEQQ